MAGIAFIIGCYIAMPVLIFVAIWWWLYRADERAWRNATRQAYDRVYGPSSWMHDTPTEGEFGPDRPRPKR